MDKLLPLFFTFLVFISMVFKLRVRSKMKDSPQNLLPAPWKPPLIGHLHHLIFCLPHHRLTELAERHGPVMHLQLGELSYIVVSSPEAARKVLKTHDINLGEMLCNLSYSITLRSSFAGRCKQHEAFISIMRKVLKALDGFSISDLFPSFKLFRVISGMRTKLEKLHHDLDVMLESIIKEHKANKASPKNNDDVTEDLVDVLLNLQDHGDLEFHLTTDNIKAVILDMLIAGTETSSTIAEWVMSEMVRNSKILKKAQAEVRRVYDRTLDVYDRN